MTLNVTNKPEQDFTNGDIKKCKLVQYEQQINPY